jgi:hypothetical protein
MGATGCNTQWVIFRSACVSHALFGVPPNSFPLGRGQKGEAVRLTQRPGRSRSWKITLTDFDWL